MKKKILVPIIAVLLLIATATTALATNMDFNFYMTPGGASAYSNATYKSDGQNAWYVTPKSYLNGVYSDWVNGETVRFRARFDVGRYSASSLYSRTNPNYGVTFNYPYTDSTPDYGIYYRLYADKPAGDPYGSCQLVGTWCP